MAAPHIHDLALIIDDLDRMGRLVRVTTEVDPAYDLAGLAYRMEGGERAVLFEKVKGHPWPVFVGLYWSRNLLADLMRRDAATLPQYVANCIRRWQQNPVDPVIVPTGPVLDVTEREVDLYSIPIPVHAEKDGGPYFDAAVVIAKDPETGVRNASIQRFMVVNKDTIHVNIDAGRHLELYLEKAKKLGRNLTFTLNCGVGPGLHFAASAPAEAAPPEADELGIASEFDGRPLELVKASNGYDDMVADAMWALECEMIPGENASEGPFAEVTGYYAKVEPRPVVHVRKIHRRAKPVFQTILSGMEVWNSVGLLGEANVLALLQKQVPGVSDVYFSHGGSGFYHAVVSLGQKRAGWSKQAIMAAFAAFPPLKMVTVVDDDVDIHSSTDVEWAMATRLNPKTGIVVIDESFGHGLNPSFPDYLGPKVGFDATQPFPPRPEYERVTYKPMALDAVRLVENEIHSPAPLDMPGADPGLPAHLAGKSKAEIQAWEADLARPAPIGAADLRGAAAREEDDMTDDDPDAWIARPQPAKLDTWGMVERESDEDDDDPDAWIARPQPARLGAYSGVERDDDDEDDEDDPDAWIARPQPAQLGVSTGVERGDDDDDDDDPDAWLARPQRADLAALGAAPAPAQSQAEPTNGRIATADPDADLARPQPIDLATLGWRDSGAEAADDDPDAWIARPQPAVLDIPRAEPLVDGAARRAARKAAKAPRKEDPDAWLARPQPASFEVPTAAQPVAPAPKPAATERAVKTPAAASGDRQDEEAAPAPIPAPPPPPAPSSGRAARLVGAGPAEPRDVDKPAAPKPESRGGASAFFEATTASVPAPRVASSIRGNGRATPRPTPPKAASAKSAQVADEEGGFFG